MNSVTIGNLGITLNIGETYNHPKWGNYKIISFVNGERMIVQFENEEVKELTIKIAANQIFNTKCEIAKSLNRKTIKVSGTENQIAYTIGRIAVHGYLCITGILNREYDAFKVRYEKAGNRIDKVEHTSLLPDNCNKWGKELSIQLPKKFVQNDYFALPEDTNIIENKDGTYTINDNRFWWSLIENFGFQLGDKQDIEYITERMPKTMREYFINGTKEEN